RGRDRPSECDECERAASVAALLLVRACPAGSRPQRLGRQAGECRDRPARVLPPSQAEQRRPDGDVRAVDGAGGGGSLEAARLADIRANEGPWVPSLQVHDPFGGAGAVSMLAAAATA